MIDRPTSAHSHCATLCRVVCGAADIVWSLRRFDLEQADERRLVLLERHYVEDAESPTSAEVDLSPGLIVTA
jgi:hypothetical protein